MSDGTRLAMFRESSIYFGFNFRRWPANPFFGSKKWYPGHLSKSVPLRSAGVIHTPIILHSTCWNAIGIFAGSLVVLVVRNTENQRHCARFAHNM